MVVVRPFPLRVNTGGRAAYFASRQYGRALIARALRSRSVLIALLTRFV